MDVTSLHTNIPQEEGMQTKRMSQLFHNNDPPIPTHYLREMLLSLVLTESSFEFNGKNYLHTNGVTIGTETAVSVCKYLHGGD